MKAINSRENATYKLVSRLVTSSAERRKSGLSLLEGPHLLAASLDAGHRPEHLVVSKAGLGDPEIARLVDRSSPAAVFLFSDPLFASVSSVETPQGVIASVRTPRSRVPSADARLVLLLEDIQDPGNVGTLFRSAAAAGAGHVLLSPTCAFAWSPKVLRAAMGAHFAVNIVERADLPGYLAGYRGTSVALAGEARRSLYDLDLRGPLAFVVGNEGAGISRALLDAAGETAAIPMANRIESLNAAAAGTIALFEAVRQRQTGQSRPKSRRPPL